MIPGPGPHRDTTSAAGNRSLRAAIVLGVAALTAAFALPGATDAGRGSD
jgi:hypothetical protein